MAETTLTSKGQVTVPREIRERLGLAPGDKLAFTLLSDGTVIMRAKTRRLLDLAGSLTRPKVSISLDANVLADCLLMARGAQLGRMHFVTFDAGAAKLPFGELLV